MKGNQAGSLRGKVIKRVVTQSLTRREFDLTEINTFEACVVAKYVENNYFLQNYKTYAQRKYPKPLFFLPYLETYIYTILCNSLEPDGETDASPSIGEAVRGVTFSLMVAL